MVDPEAIFKGFKEQFKKEFPDTPIKWSREDTNKGKEEHTDITFDLYTMHVCLSYSKAPFLSLELKESGSKELINKESIEKKITLQQGEDSDTLLIEFIIEKDKIEKELSDKIRKERINNQNEFHAALDRISYNLEK